MASTKTKKRKKRKVSAFKKGFWRRHWKEVIILFVVSVGLYLPTVGYDFVLDDAMVITDNDFTKAGKEGIADIFSNDSFTGYFGKQKQLVAGARYRPFTLAMFALEREMFGRKPFGHHLISVILYGMLTLLIFRISAVLLYHRKPDLWFIGIPFLAAMIYATHPVHSEVVANIKGRDEIMSMLGAMLALYASLRYLHKKQWWWLLASAVFFAIGVFSKENALTFLAVIPAAGYFFSRASVQRLVLAAIPALLVSAGYIFIRCQVIGFLLDDTEITELMNNPFVEMSGSEKWATVVYTLGWYLKLLVFPHPLTHDYYPYHVPIVNWTNPLVWACVLVYAGLICVLIRGVLTRSPYAFCVFFFFATLSLVSNVLFPVGAFMNERFIFMPSYAYCLALPLLAAGLAKNKPRFRTPVFAAIGVMVLLFGLKTELRIPAWRNKLSLNTAAVQVSSESARANAFMGTALYEASQSENDREKRMENMLEAERYVDKALKIHPTYYSANQMKSGIIAEHYRYDRDLTKLLNEFEMILRVKPNVEYIRQYSEYLNGLRRNANQLLDFYYRVGYDVLSSELCQYSWARVYLNYGLQLDPDHARLNWAMGQNYLVGGDPARGRQFLEKAYALDPSLRQ